MATLGYGFFSEINYSILFYSLVWQQPVPPIYRQLGSLELCFPALEPMVCIQVGIMFTSIVFLKKPLYFSKLPQIAGIIRATREEVACRNHKVIHSPWTDCVDDCVHEVMFNSNGLHCYARRGKKVDSSGTLLYSSLYSRIGA